MLAPPQVNPRVKAKVVETAAEVVAGMAVETVVDAVANHSSDSHFGSLILGHRPLVETFKIQAIKFVTKHDHKMCDAAAGRV